MYGHFLQYIYIYFFLPLTLRLPIKDNNLSCTWPCTQLSCFVMQDFLLEMGGYYELVLFTDQPAGYAEPIMAKLDPHR